MRTLFKSIVTCSVLAFFLMTSPVLAGDAFQAKVDLGYFMGMSSDFTDVYDGAMQFSVGAKFRFTDWLRMFLDVSYLTASGEAAASKDFPYIDPPSTDFTTTGATLGLEYVYSMESMKLYAGLGVSYLMWTESWSGDDVESSDFDDSTMGYEVHGGLDYYLGDAFFINGELRYQMASIDVPDAAAAEYLGDTRDFSGISLFLGAGYTF